MKSSTISRSRNESRVGEKAATMDLGYREEGRGQGSVEGCKRIMTGQRYFFLVETDNLVTDGEK
jgi:hypothetical protein